MRRRPERILLFRSGRHLRVALDVLRADSPGCEITVVATPAAATALDRLGVDTAHRIIYERTPFFRPWPFITSAAGMHAIARRAHRVCVLWNDPDGFGQANVDQAALLVSRGGFTAITADGTLIVRHTGPLLAREVSRGMVSVAVATILGLCLFLPARVLRALRA